MFHLLKLLCRNGLNLKAKINIQLKSGYFLTFAKVLKKFRIRNILLSVFV